MKRSFVRIGTVLLVSILMCSCVPQPRRVSGITYTDVGQIAYVLNSGTQSQLDLDDIATIAMIDGTDFPQGLDSEWNRIEWTPIEVPAGKHTVEIVYREASFTIGAIFFLLGDPNMMIPLEVSRRILVVELEPNRLYRPHAGDDCGREWFWIEDLGLFDAEKLGDTSSDGTDPVVAGYAPPGDCKQLN